jgi:hypothetical protein
MKYIIIGLSTMLLGLFLGALGMLTIQKYTTPKPIVIAPTPTPIPIITPTIINDPTQNWKTYTNSITQYSIKYPANWQLIDLTGGKQIEIYSQPDKTKPVGELLIENTNSIGGTELYTQEKPIGTSTASCKTDGITKTWCYIRINANTYMTFFITKDTDIEYNKTLERILSTFKFIEPTAESGIMCGGIAGKTCPAGYVCQMTANYPDASGTCVRRETYTCPANGWVDCMPGPDKKPECSQEAMGWYKANCPGFKGGAL